MHTIFKHAAAITVSVLLFGCDGAPSPADSIETDVSQETIAVDTYCGNGGCEAVPSATVTLTLDASASLPENDAVHFLQYRVDYALSAVDDIPYFAGETDIALEGTQTVSVSFPIAGNRQREHIFNAVGGKRISGTAQVTLEGYDEKDQLVDIAFSTTVIFADFTIESDTEGAMP